MSEKTEIVEMEPIKEESESPPHTATLAGGKSFSDVHTT